MGWTHLKGELCLLPSVDILKWFLYCQCTVSGRPEAAIPDFQLLLLAQFRAATLSCNVVWEAEDSQRLQDIWLANAERSLYTQISATR